MVSSRAISYRGGTGVSRSIGSASAEPDETKGEITHRPMPGLRTCKRVYIFAAVAVRK